MSSKKLLVFVVLLALVGAIAYLAFRPSRPEPAVLKVGYSPYSVNLVTFVAYESGLLKQAGFEAQMVPFQSTDALAAALKNGDVDVASALTAEAVYSFNQTAPNTLQPFFFNVFTAANRLDALVVAQNSPINGVADLRQKKVGVLPANMMKVAFASYLQKNGLAVADVEVIGLPPASILSALASGDVAAAYVLEPMISVAEEKLKARVIDSGIAAKGISNPLPAGFHCVRTAWSSAEPGRAKKLAAIFGEAVARINSQPKESRQLLTKYAGIDVILVEKVRLPDWSAFTDALKQPLKAQFEALQSSQNWPPGVFQHTKYLE